MLLIPNLYAFQYLGEKGWLQIDRVAGLEGPIRGGLEQHGPPWILKENLAGLGARAACGAAKTEQDQ